MNIESVSLRKPKAAYEGRNGFLQAPVEAEQVNDSNLQDALARHRRALFVIDHKSKPVPSLEEMKAEVERPDDDLAHVKEKLKTLREQHLNDLQLLYRMQAGDYKIEAMDRYLSKDDGQEGDGQNLSPAELRLQEIYSDAVKDQAFKLEWQADYERARYAYLSQLIALTGQRRDIELREEEARKRREQMFPLSIPDFKSKGKDVQLRAARFLVADQANQQKFMEKFGWAWRQVKPLRDIFLVEEAFAADVRAMVLSEQSVRDPRKARLAAT